MAKYELKEMMRGALVLTIAAFIAKILSAVYRVPLQNLVGDEGFYVYQQVYPFYGLAMTLALTGLPQFISKYVAENDGLDDEQTLGQLTTFVSMLALVLWAGLFIFSRPIAFLMGDLALQGSIQVVSFTFLLIPPLTMYRGHLQGQLILVPTAISQVIEQFIRVGIILLAAASFHWLHFTIYQVGEIAMAGSFIGGLVAVVILFYAHRRQSQNALPFWQKKFWQFPKAKIRRRFLVEGGLVSLYSGYLLILQLIDSFFLVNALRFRGTSFEVARIEKGIFDRGQPLVQLGLVVALSLSMSFLPTLTNYSKNQKPATYLFASKLFLRLTVAIGFAASVGLALVMPYINYTLFTDSVGNDVLSVFVFSIVLMAIVQSYQSIAQSRNHFRPAYQAAFLGFGIKVVLTPVLVYFMGTLGASYATILALVCTLLWFIRKESKEINQFWTERAFGWRLLASVAVMSVSIRLFYRIALVFYTNPLTRVAALYFTLAGVFIGIVSFVVSMIYFKLFNLREWFYLPYGKKILRKMGRKK